MIKNDYITIGKARTEIAAYEPASEVKEYHLMIHACPSDNFSEQLESVNSAFDAVCSQTLQDAHPVFMRYFISDAANQEEAIKSSVKCGCPVSVIEQPPLDGTKVALWVYLTTPLSEHYEHLWTASSQGISHSAEAASEPQTSAILQQYQSDLALHGCTVEDNCIRTWFFVQNVDVNYAGVVKGRREFFDTIGLTSQTHYIASTGIAGRTAAAASKVMMDAYSVKGLAPEQITYIKGSTHLNPTHEYGVTFERGTAVDYGDRRHVFISGTASIDNKGQVVHPGDVRRQTERMLENVSVLLDEAGCGYEDVAHMIVYLRDIADYAAVKAMYEERFPTHPKVFLWAPVCRPGWLVEMECMAVRPVSNGFMKL